MTQNEGVGVRLSEDVGERLDVERGIALRRALGSEDQLVGLRHWPTQRHRRRIELGIDLQFVLDEGEDVRRARIEVLEQSRVEERIEGREAEERAVQDHQIARRRVIVDQGGEPWVSRSVSPLAVEVPNPRSKDQAVSAPRSGDAAIERVRHCGVEQEGEPIDRERAARPGERGGHRKVLTGRARGLHDVCRVFRTPRQDQ